MIIVLIFCLIACFTNLMAEVVSDSKNDSDKEYIIGTEDVLEIRVWGQDNLNRTVEVSKEGAFTFPLIGKVHASGLSVFGLEKLLTQSLSKGYLVKPQVTVSIATYRSQKVFLLGEVKKPGSYALKGKTHILELISDAGGLTDRAGRTITIVRSRSSHNKSAPVALEDAKEDEIITIYLDELELTADGMKSIDIFIADGDSIYISKARKIYVTGEVKKPGGYKWERGITVHQAISLAGGATKRGATNRTKIIRTKKGLERELKPSMSDKVIPDDIIKVPISYF